MLINFGRGSHAKRRRSQRTWTNLAGSVQSLEPRALLAGTVLVTVNATGDVKITGDNKDNAVQVDFTEEGVFVSSDDNRTKIVINGQNFGVIDEGQLIVEDESTIRSVTIDMKNGDDFVDLQFIGNIDVEIAKDISINLGNGDDELAVELFDGDVSLHVLGSIKIDSGSGSDFIGIYDDSFAETIDVEGLVSIKTGTGSDGVEAYLQAFEVGGNFEIDTGHDSDYVDVEFDGPAHVGGSLSVKTGDEDDAVSLLVDEGSLTVDGKATIDLGVDDDVLVMGLSSLILDVGSTILDEGDFDFDVDTDIEIKGNAGDDVLALGGISVGRDLKIDTGTGDDVIGAVMLSVGRDLDVKTGLGNDLVSAEDIEVERSTLLDAGSGNDAVAVTGIVTGNAANSKLSVNLGSGSDELAVGTLTLGDGVGTRVTINGGSGEDDIASETDLDDDNIATGLPVFGFEGDGADGEEIANATEDAIFDALDDEFGFFK